VEFEHKPVMLKEVLELLNCKRGGVYVDCTLGGGGHAEKICENILPDGLLIGIDRDLDSIEASKKKLERYKNNIELVHDNFVNIKKIVKNLGIEKVDGILYDLGVSSYQLDNPERGFSYKFDAPLDMRMDQTGGKTAQELINELSEEELAAIIKRFGEEKWASRIAKFIVERRKQKEIKTTKELVKIIKQAIPFRSRQKGPHPAKRTFQALRIFINDELECLKQSLYDAVDLLKPKGRICVISFHSLEDRIVKKIFLEKESDCECPTDFPICVCDKRKELEILTRKPLTPGPYEIKNNPRARSAKLRAGEKVDCSKPKGE